MTLTVGIAGITGKFAGLLVSHLLRHQSVVIRGYCRNASKLDASIRPQIQITEGDALDEAKVAEFVRPCDVVVCAYLGDNDLMLDGQKVLIDACTHAEVPRYFAGDWSLDYTRLSVGELPPKDPMIRIMANLLLRRHPRGVHVLNGVFTEVLFSPFFGAYDAAAKKLRYWGEGTETIETTTYGNAAEYTAAMIMDPLVTGIQRILGDRKSFKEIAELYKRVYGDELTLENLGSVDDLNEKKERVRAENPDDMRKWMGLFYTYHMLGGRTFVGPNTHNDKFPDVKPVTIEDFMNSHDAQGLANALFSI